MRRLRVAVTTDGAGAFTGYSARFSGKIESIHYVKDGTTPFTDGVDFTITAEATGENIWTESNVNASAVRRPRAPAHDQVGVALLYAAGGTAQADKITLGNDRVKFVLAAGGAAKLGAFIILVGN